MRDLWTRPALEVWRIVCSRDAIRGEVFDGKFDRSAENLPVFWYWFCGMRSRRRWKEKEEAWPDASGNFKSIHETKRNETSGDERVERTGRQWSERVQIHRTFRFLDVFARINGR